MISNTNIKSGVYIKTFGCQMNEYDTEKMLLLLSDSYAHVHTPEEAEVVLINTCSVREKGEHKLRSLLGKLKQIKQLKESVVIGVTGCVAQQEGHNLIKKHPFINFVVGTHNLSLIPSLTKAAKDGSAPQVAIDYRDEWEDLPDGFISNSSVRALVSIQRGCNKNCSFCVVPNTRGKEVSRAPDEIERETRLKVRLGAKEVLLLGQTVNSYGRDFNPKYPFERLIEQLAKIEGLERIRFTSPHPQEVRPEFIKLYKDIPKLCPHIHLPLQSGSDRILKLMNRNYHIKRYLKIVDLLRGVRPDLAITSDIIVGFPTETERDFADTMKIIEDVKYNLLYCFLYSPRPKTEANKQFRTTDGVLHDIASKRLQQLQQLQEDISLNLNKKSIGSSFQVLVEGHKSKISSLMKGRNIYNILVEVLGDNISIGDMIDVVVEHAGPYGLRGRYPSVSVCNG
jgi:tRNA-2-methylthio-N6-dimethylallyladenosine synthase